jgi:hypothetical protein
MPRNTSPPFLWLLALASLLGWLGSASPGKAEDPEEVAIRLVFIDPANHARTEAANAQRTVDSLKGYAKDARDRAAKAPDAATRQAYELLATQREDAMRLAQTKADEALRQADYLEALAAKARRHEPLEFPQRPKDLMQSFVELQKELRATKAYLSEMNKQITSDASRWRGYVDRLGDTANRPPHPPWPVTPSYEDADADHSWYTFPSAIDASIDRILGDTVLHPYWLQAYLEVNYTLANKYVKDGDLRSKNVLTYSATEIASRFLDQALDVWQAYWNLSRSEAAWQIAALQNDAYQWFDQQKERLDAEIEAFDRETEAAYRRALDNPGMPDYVAGNWKGWEGTVKFDIATSARVNAACARYATEVSQHIEDVAAQMQAIANHLNETRKRLITIRQRLALELKLAGDPKAGHADRLSSLTFTSSATVPTMFAKFVGEGKYEWHTGHSLSWSPRDICSGWRRSLPDDIHQRFPAITFDNKRFDRAMLRLVLAEGQNMQGKAEGRDDNARP